MYSVPTSLTRILGAILVIGTASLAGCTSPVNPNQQDDRDEGPGGTDQTGMIVPEAAEPQPIEPDLSPGFGDDLA